MISTSVWEDIKREFQSGNMVTRIIMINAAVFISVNLLWVGLYFFNAKEYLDSFLQWFEASSHLWHNLTRPWTIITHMFLQADFMHFAFNMLFMYWFGSILKDLVGDRRILPIYILGGLAGFVAYIIAANILPAHISNNVGTYALGASAAVMATVWATATTSPNYSVRLLFIGDVQLKYIAIALTLIDLFTIDSNTGGRFAHLGGAFMGWFIIYQMRKGNDLTVMFNKWWDKITAGFDSLKDRLSNKNKPHVAYKNPNKDKGGRSKPSRNRQERIDAILDKIKRSGYDSLTNEEKEFLFHVSNDD